MKAILKGVLTVCMAALLLFPVRAAATEVGQPGDNIASGTVDGITWVIDAAGKLTITGTGDLPEKGYKRTPWCSNAYQITSAEINVSGMTDASYLLAGCIHLQGSIDISGFDTSQVTNMEYMFLDCSDLTSLDLSGFDTSKVTDMKGMFYNCSSLTSLDVSNFDTSQVTDMDDMFYGCSGLTSLDVSGFDTSQVTGMSELFEDCSGLTSLDVSNFDTSQVTDMDDMFYGCSGLTSLDVSGFDTSQVTNMWSMFYGCSGLTSLDVSGFNTSQVTNMLSMFYGCSGLTSLDVSGFNTSQVTDMNWMFGGCSGLTSLDVSGFNTSQVTGMSGLFEDCSGLTSLDVSGFNTSQVKDMWSMFNGCSGLTSLDVSGFDTSQVTGMSELFEDCSGLTSLDVSGFDTSQVMVMDWMFCGCSGLTSLDVSGFNTSQVIMMHKMFSGCSGLTSLDVSGFNTSQVTYMAGMFNGCNSLTSLDLSGFDMSRLKDDVNLGCNNMFSECSNLTSLNTPLNLQLSALLPEVGGQSWHMPDGTVVTELPQNLDYSVLLTRDAAAPEITTTTADLNMEDVIRVKYVPYSYTVETNNTDAENTVTFSIEEGRLPEGLMIYPATGEIYGVPMEVGEFPLTIKATFSNEYYLPSYAEITLIVLENTPENIAKATEPGYEITQPVIDFSLEGMSGEETQTLVSQGEYAQFKDVYLDGRKLIANEEYTSEAGSTRITIRNQTLGGVGEGTHTLGIEFRTEEGTLKRAAQNYTVSQTSAGSESEGQPETSESESQPENNESESQPEANESENQPSVTPSPANNNSSGDNSNNAAGTQAVTAEAQMTEVIYTVQPGDNLWKIASKYRKQGVTWQKIYADNAAVIKNPGLIFAGQQLRIRFAATDGAQTPAVGAYSESYSVKPGDTLWGIAAKIYGDGRLWTRIYEANRDVLENPDRIRIGQILMINQ